LLLRWLLALFWLVAPTAQADSTTTREALDRLEEILQLRMDEGRLKAEDVMPTVLVSAQPRYEASASWFATGAIEALQSAFGNSGLRLCEACMVPRAYVGDGALTWQTGPASLDEIARLDEQARGDAQAARTATWIDEQPGGVSARIVDLRTGRVVFAQNVDPALVEHRRTQRVYTQSEELERRARGESVTQAFVDIALIPGQHVSLDWTEQWGPTNRNLSGITLSMVDPVAGIGAVHYRVLDVANTLVGGKAVISLPTAAVRSFDQGDDVIDPLLTIVGVVRVPFGRSNYGGVLSLSSNGVMGIGLSLMNVSVLPVIP